MGRPARYVADYSGTALRRCSRRAISSDISRIPKLLVAIFRPWGVPQQRNSIAAGFVDSQNGKMLGPAGPKLAALCLSRRTSAVAACCIWPLLPVTLVRAAPAAAFLAAHLAETSPGEPTAKW